VCLQSAEDSKFSNHLSQTLFTLNFEDSKFSNHLSQTLFTLNFVVKSKCIYPELRALSELTQIPTPYHLQNTNKSCRSIQDIFHHLQTHQLLLSNKCTSDHFTILYAFKDFLEDHNTVHMM